MELLREIWATAKRNKLRTSLTGLAVAWGIFMLIVLLGAGNGVINALTQQNNRHLTRSVTAYAGHTSKPYHGLKEGRRITLNTADVHTTATAFPDKIDDVTPELMRGRQTVSLGQEYVLPKVAGVAPSSSRIEKVEMLGGRFINDIDMRDRRKVAVVSNSTAKELLPPGRNIIGRRVNIEGVSFLVVGVYKADESSQDSYVYTPFSTYNALYNKGDEVERIIFSFHGIDGVEDNDKFEDEYKRRIYGNHSVAPDDNSAVWLWNRYKESLQMDKGMNIVRLSLWILGMLTLLSGVVGVSNIMLITVKERTHEFGIRKAIGAKPVSILKLIIVESVAITSIFGYVGMMAGMLANEWMDRTVGGQAVEFLGMKAALFLDPTVGLGVCLKATLVMIAAGTVAGLIPAFKAARVRPIEALRG